MFIICHLKTQSDQLYDVSDFMAYDPTQDIIFPPELLVSFIRYSFKGGSSEMYK